MMTPENKGTAQPGVSSLQDVKDELGPDLCALLDFKQSKNLVKIKPKQFLGKDVFAEVAGRIRACGGNYSKDEHLFRVWLVVSRPQGRRKPKRRALVDIVKDLSSLLEELEAWVE